MSKRKTREEWQNESDIKYNKEFVILCEPKSANDLTDVFHKKCGNISSIRLSNHLKRYCKYCSGKNKKSLIECQKESDVIHNSEFVILDEPINIKTNVKILHKVCNSVLLMTMNNHLSHKNGCKKCSKQSLKSNEYWLNRCKEIWGNEFEILDYVDNVWKKVRTILFIIKEDVIYVLERNMESFLLRNFLIKIILNIYHKSHLVI